MTVKIIDEIPDPKIVKQITCRNCGVRLEYVPNDVRERNGTDYDEGPNGEEWIDCPNCGKRVIIRVW